MSETIPNRWSKIDRIEINGYPYLKEDDQCFYYLERSHGTWRAGKANSLVSNFQKSIIDYRDRPEVMQHKRDAIAFFADKIGMLFAHKKRRCPIVIVPMVTSKPKTAEYHDSRLIDTAEQVARHRAGEVVVCDILDIDSEIPKAKLGGPRRPQEISAHIVVTDSCVPDADIVFLIDDVITTGGHFAACQDAIKPLFPHAQIVGVFLSRQSNDPLYEYADLP